MIPKISSFAAKLNLELLQKNRQWVKLDHAASLVICSFCLYRYRISDHLIPVYIFIMGIGIKGNAQRMRAPGKGWQVVPRSIEAGPFVPVYVQMRMPFTRHMDLAKLLWGKGKAVGFSVDIPSCQFVKIGRA